MTLAELRSLDFARLWASLPAETQARIGALALEHAFADQVADDGGFHTTERDRIAADRMAQGARDALPAANWEAFPDLLPVTHDEPYPLWQVLDGCEPPKAVTVRGLEGRRDLVETDDGWFVPDGGRLVALGGAVDLDSRRTGAPPRWLFWTAADIEAERLRRHPEMAFREAAE